MMLIKRKCRIVSKESAEKKCHAKVFWKEETKATREGNMGHILNLNFQETAITWLQKKGNIDAKRQIFFSLQAILAILKN